MPFLKANYKTDQTLNLEYEIKIFNVRNRILQSHHWKSTSTRASVEEYVNAAVTTKELNCHHS